MPPAAPPISVVADASEPAELPLSSTPAVADSQRSRKRRARAFLARRAGRRARRTASYYDPLFSRPDVIENDYYRFRNHPRD